MIEDREQDRKSIRIKDYDYSQDGFYFITACTQGYKHLFSKVKDNEMVLNELGKIVEEEWLKTEQFRFNVKMDEFIVMPNHFHGVICIDNGLRRGVACYAQKQNNQFKEGITRYAPTKGSLSAIIRGFKSAVTRRINKLYNNSGKSIWQRNYYEHIIRNEQDLTRLQNYIINNPITWQNDEYYK